MATIVKPILWRGEILSSGSFPQPQGMSETAYLSLYGAGNLVDLSPSDMVEDYSEEEFQAVLSMASTFGKGCYHCRKRLE